MFITALRKTALAITIICLFFILFWMILKIAFRPVDLAENYVAADSALGFLVKDVDFDGKDEIFTYDFREEAMPNYLNLVDQDLKTIDQVEFKFSKKYCEFSWADVDNDRDLELGVSYKISDSFYIQFYDCADGALLKSDSLSFLQGKDNDFSGEWDGYYHSIGMIDVNDDGIDEIIFHVFSMGDYQPRALIAFNTIKKEIVWKIPFGAALGWFRIDDFNGDGFKEILSGSMAFTNSKTKMVNGTYDENSSIFLIDRYGKIMWRRIVGGKYSWCTVKGWQYAGDDEPNIFAVVTPASPNDTINSNPFIRTGKIMAYSGKTGELLDHRILGDGIEAEQYFVQKHPCSDYNGPLLTRGGDGYFRIYNKNFDVIRISRKYVALEDRSWHVSNNNNMVVMAVNGNNQFIFLNEYFTELASYDMGGIETINGGLVHSTPDTIIAIITRGKNTRLFGMFKMPPRFLAATNWWLSENIWEIISLAILFGLFYLLPLLIMLRTSFKAIEVAMVSDSGLIALTPKNRLIYASKSVRDILDLPKRWRWKKTSSLLPESTAGNFNEFLKERTNKKIVDKDSNIPIKTPFGLKMLSIELIKRVSIYGLPIDYFKIEDIHTKSTKEMVVDWFELSSRIAHRIKTPISHSMRSVEIARSYLSRDRKFIIDNIDKELDDAYMSLKDSIKMVEKFLRFPLKEVNPEDCELFNLVQMAIDYAILPAINPIEYNIDMDDRHIMIKTDQELFRELLTLIIQNSIEAMDSHNGKINISSKSAQITRGNKSINVIKIIIEDNGCGMKQEDVSRAFEPFFTNKSDIGGTGLGLSVAKRICDMIDADITMESELNRGTRVTITVNKNEGENKKK